VAHQAVAQAEEAQRIVANRYSSGLLTIVDLLTAEAALQQARTPGAAGDANDILSGALGRLFAVAEAYPELKANENFQHLQGRISGLENAIADRREFYNDSVNLNNVRIEQFPEVIVARMFNFQPADLLEFDAGELTDVDVKQLFNS